MKRWITTPWWLYFSCAILSVIIMLISFWHGINQQFSGFLINFASGFLVSVVFAFLIDVTATKRQNRKDDEQFQLLTAGLKYRFRCLRRSVVEISYDRYGFDDRPQTFEEWLEAAMDINYTQEEMTDDDFQNFMFDIEYEIEKINQSAIDLHSKSVYMLDNHNVSPDFRNSLNRMNAVSSTILSEFEKDNFDKCREYIINHLIPRFNEIFPSDMGLFNTPYNNNEEEL